MQTTKALLSVIALSLALGFGAAQAAEQGAAPAAAGASSGPASGKATGNVQGQTPPAAKGMNQPDVPASTESNAGLSAEGDAKAKANTKAEGDVKAKGANDADNAVKVEGKDKAKNKDKAKADRDLDRKAKAKAKAEGDVDAKAQKKAKTQGGVETETKSGAAADGGSATKGGKTVRLESTQVTKVKTYFSQRRPTVTPVEKSRISVSIGIAIPASIVLYDLPPDVIVVSGTCPIEYFVWGDDVVLVDSCTREVVEIIVGVA